jgi:hypothetical protein
VERAAAVAVEPDPPPAVVLEERPDVPDADAPEVEALREADDVAGEAVAADVRRLPDRFRPARATERLVEGSPVLRAAAVALAVRADDQERLVDGDGRRAASGERGGEVEVDEIVVAVELERVEALRAGPRRAEVERSAAVRAALGLLDEEETGVRQARELVAEVSLEPRGEEAAAEDVAVPEAAVLDEDPVVDAARGRREGLGAAARDLRAERFRHHDRHGRSLPHL